MIKIDIPNYGVLELEYLVLDYNGTLAVDGEIVNGVAKLLNKLSCTLDICVVTADTFGKAANGLNRIDCQLTVLDLDKQDEAKLKFIEELGIDRVVSIGNGRNDRLMLKYSALGIAVMLSEGLSSETIFSADVVCNNIVSALDLLLNPKRLIATLRS